MYTTNIIESIHRQFRKVIKRKAVFTSGQALEKMLYSAAQNVNEKMDYEAEELGFSIKSAVDIF